MNFYHFFTKSKYIVILTMAIMLPLPFSGMIFANFMQSPTYKMQSDSINLGGANGGSSNYNLNDTLGELATGDSNSTNYYMHAGYWQMQESYIAISSPTDLVMSSMAGLSGGSSEGTMSWLVTTDNTAGYNMSVVASTSPALKSVIDSLSDYTPAGADPDYNFINLPTNSTFGFSPEGTEVLQRFKDNGSICNAGTNETTGKCWDGLSTTPKIVAGSTSANSPTGSNATLRFRAESGVDHIQMSGNYNVVITATATTL